MRKLVLLLLIGASPFALSGCIGMMTEEQAEVEPPPVEQVQQRPARQQPVQQPAVKPRPQPAPTPASTGGGGGGGGGSGGAGGWN